MTQHEASHYYIAYSTRSNNQPVDAVTVSYYVALSPRFALWHFISCFCVLCVRLLQLASAMLYGAGRYRITWLQSHLPRCK